MLFSPHPTDFDRLRFHFNLVQNIFSILLWFLLWPISYLEARYRISKSGGFFVYLSSLISLWSDSEHCIISVLWSLLRCVLWPRTLSILVNVPHEFEKNTSGVSFLIFFQQGFESHSLCFYDSNTGSGLYRYWFQPTPPLHSMAQMTHLSVLAVFHSFTDISLPSIRWSPAPLASHLFLSSLLPPSTPQRIDKSWVRCLADK